MKKLLALLVVLMMVLSVVGCAAEQPSEEPAEQPAEQPTEQPAEEPTEGKPLRFILSNAYYTAPYCAAYNPSAEATAKALGIELTILDGNGNQQTQLEHANMAIADGYDGFLYFPADVEGALPVIEALNESGIAWAGVNAYPGDKIADVGMKYYIGPDATAHGITMAGVLKEKYPNGANVVAIEGTAGHMQTININGAFDQELNDSYVFLDRQDCNFQAELAMTKMTDMLTAYGVRSQGGQIDCIISHDGGMLTGIMSALEAAGLKPGDVDIIAMGSNQVIYDALKSGWLSATSTQDPVAEAALAVQTLYDAMQGTAAEGWTKLPTPVATPENCDEFNWF